MDQDILNHTGPLIDLERKHFDRIAQGCIRIIGTWLQHNGEPCIVLLPALKSPVVGNVTPFVVRQRSAHLWAPDTAIGDARYVMQQCQLAAPALQMNPFNPSDLFTITTAVQDSLDELIMMPPPPQSDRVVVADAIAIDVNTGKEAHSGEIFTNV